MNHQPVQQAIDKELEQAQAARSSGKEGMARVCARRAAGIAIGEYLRRNQIPDPGPSAMDRLERLRSLPQTPLNLRQNIAHLTQRVNENYELPPEIDLLGEAQALIRALLPDLFSE